jgi:hypothetical protein
MLMRTQSAGLPLGKPTPPGVEGKSGILGALTSKKRFVIRFVCLTCF